MLNHLKFQIKKLTRDKYLKINVLVVCGDSEAYMGKLSNLPDLERALFVEDVTVTAQFNQKLSRWIQVEDFILIGNVYHITDLLGRKYTIRVLT